MRNRIDASARHRSGHHLSILWMVVVGGLFCVLVVVGLGFRAIAALDARDRLQHERMLEDTQSLADESGSLVQENVARLDDIAALKRELAALRSEVAALRHARR
jgi:hypothetical protein